MGRKRYQQPSIFRTTGKRPMWFFRARVDAISGTDGERSITRPEERYYVGYTDEMTKQDAKKRRDEILGEAINRPQVLIPSQVKFGEVLKIYRREHLPNLRETTRDTQERILSKHMDAQLGALRMCDLDAMAVQRWLTGMELAYRTKAAYLSLLRVIWNKAEEWGYTNARFPLRKGSLGVKRDVKGRQLPSMDQLRRLLAELEDPYRAMAEIAMFTGLRISEVRGLQWQDVAADSLIVRRRVSDHGGVDVPKSLRSTRAFDLRPVAAALSRMPRKDEWIFNHAGCSYANCRTKMAEARKAAGITIARFSWHHLRAVFNTLARSSGADSLDRQALLGHSSDAMNAVYIMADGGELKRRGDLMLQVQGLILGQTKGIQ